jgi:hypothetical protein
MRVGGDEVQAPELLALRDGGNLLSEVSSDKEMVDATLTAAIVNEFPKLELTGMKF